MSKNIVGFFLLITFIGLGTYSCTSTTTETIQLTLSAKADGPFFEGPNSLMADFEASKYLTATDTEVDASKIVKANLKSISVGLNETDSINFQSFSSASFQIVGGDLPMTSAIAILNPIESSENAITLSPSDEADLADYLKEKKFTGILDLELIEYLEKESLGAEIKLEFTVEIKN